MSCIDLNALNKFLKTRLLCEEGCTREDVENNFKLVLKNKKGVKMNDIINGADLQKNGRSVSIDVGDWKERFLKFWGLLPEIGEKMDQALEQQYYDNFMERNTGLFDFEGKCSVAQKMESLFWKFSGPVSAFSFKVEHKLNTLSEEDCHDLINDIRKMRFEIDGVISMLVPRVETVWISRYAISKMLGIYHTGVSVLGEEYSFGANDLTKAGRGEKAGHFDVEHGRSNCSYFPFRGFSGSYLSSRCKNITGHIGYCPLPSPVWRWCVTHRVYEGTSPSNVFAWIRRASS